MTILQSFCHFTALISCAFAVKHFNEIIGTPHVECEQNFISVRVNTTHFEPSRIFVRNHVRDGRCSFNRSNEAVFHVGECGLTRERQLKPKGLIYRAVIVVQLHPRFVTAVDRAYDINCFFSETDAMITSDLEVSSLRPKPIEVGPSLPSCSYALHLNTPSGPSVRYARVGDRVWHVWECENDSDTMGMLVHSCVAHDGHGTEIPIIDANGCTLDDYVIDTPIYNKQLTRAQQETLVFKFADVIDVRFHCQIKLCYKQEGKCDAILPPRCSRPTAKAGVISALSRDAAAAKKLPLAKTVRSGITATKSRSNAPSRTVFKLPDSEEVEVMSTTTTTNRTKSPAAATVRLLESEEVENVTAYLSTHNPRAMVSLSDSDEVYNATFSEISNRSDVIVKLPDSDKVENGATSRNIPYFDGIIKLPDSEEVGNVTLNSSSTDSRAMLKWSDSEEMENVHTVEKSGSDSTIQLVRDLNEGNQSKARNNKKKAEIAASADQMANKKERVEQITGTAYENEPPARLKKEELLVAKESRPKSSTGASEKLPEGKVKPLKDVEGSGESDERENENVTAIWLNDSRARRNVASTVDMEFIDKVLFDQWDSRDDLQTDVNQQMFVLDEDVPALKPEANDTETHQATAESQRLMSSRKQQLCLNSGTAAAVVSCLAFVIMLLSLGFFIFIFRQQRQRTRNLGPVLPYPFYKY